MIFFGIASVEINAELFPLFEIGQGVQNTSFYNPQDVVVDSQGNIYVTDSQNHRIVKLGSNGEFIKSWGNFGRSDDQMIGPFGITIDTNDNLFVSFGGSLQEIRKYDTEGNFLTKFGSGGHGDGQFKNEYGLSVDGNNNVLVADGSKRDIQIFDNEGNFIGKFGETGSNDGQFFINRDVAIDSEGNIYVADSDNHRIQIFDSNYTFIKKIGNGINEVYFQSPKGVSLDDDDNLFVADTHAHVIQKFDSDGNHLSTWGGLGNNDGEFQFPRDIFVGPGNNIYVADTNNQRIQKFDDNGNHLKTLGVPSTENEQFLGPQDMVTDSIGMIYVADSGNKRISIFDEKREFQKHWSVGYEIFAIDIDNDDNLFAVVRGGLILKFDSNGGYETWSKGENNDDLGATDITVDSDNNVYALGYNNNKIQKFDNNGEFIRSWGSQGGGQGQFNFPTDIGIDSNDNIYALYNGRIQVFDSDGEYVTEWHARDENNVPFYIRGIAIDGDGNVYLSNNRGHSIYKHSSDGSFLEKFGGYGNSIDEFYLPENLHLDDDGKIFVADTTNHKVKIFYIDNPETCFDTSQIAQTDDWYNQGIEYQQNKIELYDLKALVCFENFLELTNIQHEKFDDAYYHIGVIENRLGNCTKALDGFNEFLKHTAIHEDNPLLTSAKENVVSINDKCNLNLQEPNSVTNFIGTMISADAIKLNWTHSIDDGNTQIIEYKIEAEKDGSDIFSEIASLDHNETEFIHTPINSDSNYTYRITPINSIGDGTSVETKVNAVNINILHNFESTGSTNFQVYTDSEIKIKFEIISHSFSNLIFESDTIPPGANFDIHSGELVWTPHTNRIQDEPYEIIVNAKVDDKIISTKLITITVDGHVKDTQREEKTEIILIVPGNITKEAETKIGTSVDFHDQVSAKIKSSTEIIPLTASCDPGSGSTFQSNMTTLVECSAQYGGEIVQKTFEIIIHPFTDITKINPSDRDFIGLNTVEKIIPPEPMQINTPPIVLPQSTSMIQDSNLIIPLQGLDKENNELEFFIITKPHNGELTDSFVRISNLQSTITYSPNEGFIGIDSFSFQAKDHEFNSEPQIITIDVQPSFPTGWLAIIGIVVTVAIGVPMYFKKRH